MPENSELATWVYLDETAYDAHDGTRWRGAGALVLPAPMPTDSVAAALRDLSNDPDARRPEFQKIDSKTLERGYFHASEDSQNAHSHWINQVNAQFLGIFYYSVRQGDERADSEAFKAHLRFALMSTFSRRGRVTAVFEGRHGLSQEAAAEVVSEIYRGLDWTSYELPQVCFHYPMVEALVRGKGDPGLQAVDFLLWACLQKMINPSSSKSRWRDRIDTSFTADAPDLGEGQKYGQLRGKRNRAALKGRVVYSTEVIRNELPNTPTVQVYRVMERSVRLALRTGLPSHAEHLLSFADLAVSRLDKQPQPSAVAGMGRAFLRLFDTAPLYKASIYDEQFQGLYQAKQLAALLVRDEINGDGKVLDAVYRLRQELLSSSPQAFEIGVGGESV